MLFEYNTFKNNNIQSMAYLWFVLLFKPLNQKTMKKNIIPTVLCFFSLLVFAPAMFFTLHAQSTVAQQQETANKLIEQFDNQNTPGGVVMVMRDGKVVFQKSFGMANLTHNIPFQMNTPTNIGSTTKQFTAMGIALLQEKGLLSIEDDIRKYIPELPDLGETVRLRHLLSHTSGYREYLNSLMMGGRQMGDIIRIEEIIPLVQNQPVLQNKPGETYNYNNTGYALLAMVIERVTGEKYPEWMNKNIFQPLGMNNTLVRINPGQIIPGNAQGYIKIEETTYQEALDIPGSMGAGGIYTTMPDLEKWVCNFYNPVLGNANLIKKLQTPFRLNNGDTMSYAYGLIVGELNGLKMVEHGGADIAHRSMLMMFPEIKGAVITQSNNASFSGQIARNLAEIFFADLMEKKEEKKKQPSEPGEFVYDVKKFDELAGRYELEVAPGFILEFRREDEKLMTQATGQGAVEIFASSDSTFYLKVVQASVTFHQNADGKVEHMTLHQNGDHRANRIFEPAWKPSDEDIRIYTGRYFSPELEAFYTIALNNDGNLLLQHRRMDDLPLKPESKDEFTATFPIPQLKFIRNEKGEVTGFEASSGRSTGIVFEKQ
jgi:CubicO group peptidase (beta-lactamase class C family)